MAFLSTIDATWHHHFDNLSYASADFYNQVTEQIKQRALPGVEAKRINLSEGGIFSSKREYLRISFLHLAFDICAAPFGKEFFVSWWMGETKGAMDGVPLVGALLKRQKEARTYYQIDTRQMFKESIHAIILSTIDGIVQSKGLSAIESSKRNFSSFGVA